MTAMTFTKATRKRVKLRLALVGPSGSGKTLGALRIAKGLGGRVAVIDTEAGNVSSYSDEFDFDVLEIAAPFSPERFIEAVEAAAAAGYDTCIIDSMSAEWEGSGGCLEINEKTAAAKYKGNTWSAWSDTTPRHRAFINSLLQSRMDIIATMRSTTETVQGDDKRVRKVGMKAEQRKGTEYDFQFVFDIDHQSHLATAATNRSRMFAEPAQITVDTGKQLRDWRNSGEEQRIGEKELGRWLDNINAAQSLDELRAVFADAHTAAKRINDEKALTSIVAAKDMRKEALMVNRNDPRGNAEADEAVVSQHFAAITAITNEDIEEHAMAVKIRDYINEHLAKNQELYILVADKLAVAKVITKTGLRQIMATQEAA